MDKTMVMREMTQEEIESQQEQWNKEAAELRASMTPESKAIVENLVVLFDKVIARQLCTLIRLLCIIIKCWYPGAQDQRVTNNCVL